MPHDNLGLFDTPPTWRQVWFSRVIVGLLAFAALAIVPVRDTPLAEVPSFIPTVDAIMFLGELIAATMLYAQAVVFRSRALTVLASTFFLTALLLVTHALTFPGAFAPDGLLGAGVNSTAWVAFIRRAAFPLAVIVYVLLRQADTMAPPGPKRPAAGIVVGLMSAIALAAGATALVTAGHDLLPAYFLNTSVLIYSQALAFQSAILVVAVAAFVVLFRKRRSVLDMWLLVALAGWMIETLLILTLRGRFTAGFYGLFGVTLFCNLVVMLALIAESNLLYARLALSTAARSRERDTRLMSIDAVAGAISHEVGQPLTAVGAHASSGLKWLTRPKPDVERAISSLRDTIDAGQRVSEVIRSIRAMFSKRPGAKTEFNLNELVSATASLLGRELDSEKVSLTLILDVALPTIEADRVQIQRVLINLITNAIESLGAMSGRPRRIEVQTARADHHEVLLKVSDNGPGIAADEIAHIFEAFFTTKATGTGLGLSLCRSIAEVHGGRLWASQGAEGGATFHLQLPRSNSSTLGHPRPRETKEREQLSSIP